MGSDQARAKVLAGAPFAVDFTATVANGSLAGGATTLGVAVGSVDGTPVTVTRTAGIMAAVTVDIDLTTQPTLPAGSHSGYEFEKTPSGLPATILPAAGNNAPVFSATSTTRTVAENSAAGTNVGAVIPEATDADSDDTLTYSMEGTDAASFDFDASTRQITTITGVDYNYEATKNSYSVTVKADDGNGSTDTIAVTIDVTDVNEKSAKPDKPTLAAVTGSSTTLTATWTKPDLDGGPDIAGYAVQYKVNTATTWEDFAHSDTAITTTITGLDGGHLLPGAGAGEERGDGQRLVRPLGRGEDQCGDEHPDLHAEHRRPLVRRGDGGGHRERRRVCRYGRRPGRQDVLGRDQQLHD